MIWGFAQFARQTMTLLPASQVFLTVAIMAIAFLTEIAFFALTGMF
jgi:hypothetical protein